MKIWLLKQPEFNYYYIAGFVMAAISEKQARLLASKEAGEEGAEIWLDPARSTCEELTANRAKGFILRDYCGEGN